MGDSESECPSAEDEFGSTFLSIPKTTPKPVHVTPPILPDVEMTPVDQTVTPKTSQKKDKQKARITDDKQFIHQSFTAKPDAQTSAQKPLLLGGENYHTWGYTYTDQIQILGELKRQHKYQTLKVKIVLNPFTFPNLTSSGRLTWEFQAVIHDISEEMMMATLWSDRKPTIFLTTCGASAFKIIQTSKSKRKLVGYFENWESTLKALDTPQVFLENLQEIRTFLTNTGQQSSNANLKKTKKKSNAKKQATSTKDLLKDPAPQKSKPNKKSRGKGGSKDNSKVLAEILTLL
ncbi:unnamed protein product [Rhizophagus irregularis]|nr:unnamed protein product [Rhizophagus irregularis]